MLMHKMTLRALLPLPLGEGGGEGCGSSAAGPHPNPLPGGEGTRRWLVGIICVLLCAALTQPAFAQKTRGTALTEERIALVIGNSAYRVDPLDNPVNDARLIAGSLRSAGFNVTLHENLDRGALLNALREFGNRLNENTIAVVYYAGHGLQLRDRNYLIPIDAEIRSEDEIPISGMDLSFIL